MSPRWIKFARKEALKHEYDSWLEHHLCAVIVKGGKVVSVGFNGNNGNAFARHYCREDDCTLHAEMNAVCQARTKTRLEGTKIFVVRVRRDGSFGMAQPCEICQHVLFNYGIRKATFSVENDTVGTMKIINPATK